MKINFKKKNTGFTFIEMVIAIAVFSIVVVIGTGSLLNAYKVHKKTQDLRSIMDNLNFIMEDISKTARTGTKYQCDGGTDCSYGSELKFKDQYLNDITYKIEGEYISKLSGANFVVLNDPSQIKISSESHFEVTGADPVSFPDLHQPLLTIFLSGTIISNGDTTPFTLQTSVSQRELDIVDNGVVVGSGGGNPPPSNPVSEVLPSGAKFCSSDGEECVYDAPGTLYYGNDKFFYYALQVDDPGSITCNPGNLKFDQKIDNSNCFFKAKSESPDSFTFCAGKGEYCNNNFSTPEGIMFYGAYPFFYGKTILFKEEILCDPTSFDPEVKSIDNSKCFIEKK